MNIEQAPLLIEIKTEQHFTQVFDRIKNLSK